MTDVLSDWRQMEGALSARHVDLLAMRPDVRAKLRDSRALVMLPLCISERVPEFTDAPVHFLVQGGRRFDSARLRAVKNRASATAVQSPMANPALVDFDNYAMQLYLQLGSFLGINLCSL